MLVTVLSGSVSYHLLDRVDHEKLHNHYTYILFERKRQELSISSGDTLKNSLL